MKLCLGVTTPEQWEYRLRPILGAGVVWGKGGWAASQLLWRALTTDLVENWQCSGSQKSRNSNNHVSALGHGMTFAFSDVTYFSLGWWSRIPELELPDPQGRAGNRQVVCVSTYMNVCGERGEEEGRGNMTYICASK